MNSIALEDKSGDREKTENWIFSLIFYLFLDFVLYVFNLSQIKFSIESNSSSIYLFICFWFFYIKKNRSDSFLAILYRLLLISFNLSFNSHKFYIKTCVCNFFVLWNVCAERVVGGRAQNRNGYSSIIAFVLIKLTTNMFYDTQRGKS